MRGIALEGGGARGSFHIGAMKALKELGVTYDAVSGASIGAINGAILALGELDRLEEIWRTTEIGDMMQGDIDLIKQIVSFDFKSDYGKIRQFLLETFRQGGLDVSPFKEKLKAFIDEDRLRASPVAFGLVTLSVTDLKPIEVFIEDIPKGKLHDYILASANFPAFKDEKFDNKKMLDGCFFDNLPVSILLERGCTEVIDIRIMSFGRIRKIRPREGVTVTTIIPSEDLGKTLEVDPVRAAHNIKLGYYDTMRVMKGLKGRQYYIDAYPDEDVIIQSLMRINSQQLEDIGDLMGFKVASKRVIFEELVPLLAQVLKLEEPYTYVDLVVSFYEHLAEHMKLPRFQIMDFDTFISQVNAFYLSQPQEFETALPELAKHLMALLPTKGYGLLPQKIRHQLITRILYILYKKGDGYGIIS